MGGKECTKKEPLPQRKSRKGGTGQIMDRDNILISVHTDAPDEVERFLQAIERAQRDESRED